MIISASRRTDIPLYHMDWLRKRFEQGAVEVKNPYNPLQVKRVSLSHDDVDGIVFWTKDVRTILQNHTFFRTYPYYVQHTLTPYGRDIEPSLADKDDVLIPAALHLAEQIGAARIVWRYDPIAIGDRWTVDAHLAAFERMAKRLEGASAVCVISFLDLYRSIAKSMMLLGLRPPTDDEKLALASGIASSAKSCGMRVQTCAEGIDLAPLGIEQGKCIDGFLLGQIRGYALKTAKHSAQREACRCDHSTDIGAYGSCPAGCRYCYAGSYKAGAYAASSLSLQP